MVKRVLIVSNRQDEHANFVGQRLGARGIPFARFDTETLPTSAKIEVSNDQGGFRVQVTNAGGDTVFATDEVGSIWYRRPFLEEFAYLLRDDEQRFAVKEHEAMLENVWALMSNATWVNPRDANRRAHNKIFQLAVAEALGFRVPDTLVTNDAEKAARFFQRHEESGVVYKTMSDPFVSDEADNVRCVYTTKVEWSSKIAESIGTVACLLQECVDKAYEIRAVVVGEEVFATRIYSQETERAKVDWRRGIAGGNLRQEVELLDPETTALCVELRRILGLRFGAIDIVCTPSGRKVFLEINPNGQWLWMERLFGLPIADALVAELTGLK